MQNFNTKDKDNLIFYKIYDLFNKQTLQPLKANEYCKAMMPFLCENNNKSKSYNRIYRYLFGYWDKNGKMGNNETAFKKLSVIINAIDLSSESFKHTYRDNILVAIIKQKPNICDEIIKTLQNDTNINHIREIPFKELRSYAQSEEYEKFLFSIVKYVFCKSISVFSGQDEFLSKLKNYKITPNELLEYSKTALMEIGNNGTFALLSILRKAGFPGQINRNCDCITLLKAADIYYYHRLSDGVKIDPNDTEYCYAYSKTAYEEWNSPLAAWNMGYIWYLHETYDPLTNKKVQIPDFSTIDGSEESFLLKATEFFIFSAERNFPDAFTSLGNICDKAMICPDEWQKLTAKLYAFTKEFINNSERHAVSEKKLLSNAKTPDAQLVLCRKLLYEQAAFLGSFNGKINYYNLMIKELMQETAKMPFKVYCNKYNTIIQQIKMYIEDLCAYHVPIALTDAATLSLHMHPINEWLKDSNITISGEKIKADSDYDFIFPHYTKTGKGKNKPIEQLIMATNIGVPSLQTPWPSYYLAIICKEEARNAEAKKYAEQAYDLQHKLGNSCRAEEYKKKINALLEEYK